jgi:hypothetical protein
MLSGSCGTGRGTGRAPVQRAGSWKTAIPLVVLHPNSEVGVARLDRSPGDLAPGERAGPIMVPVKLSNDDGGFTGCNVAFTLKAMTSVS